MRLSVFLKDVASQTDIETQTGQTYNIPILASGVKNHNYRITF